MTVDASNARTQLAVSGYDYDFTFKIFADTEISVYGVDSDDAVTLLVLDTDYVVTINTETEGGTVQTGSYVDEVWTEAEPEDYDEILMLRAIPYTQTADLPARAGINETVIENALDRLAMQIQQINDAIDYSEDQDPLAVASASASADTAVAAAAEASDDADYVESVVDDVDNAISDAIGTANDIDTGHDHDGVSSRLIDYGDIANAPTTFTETFTSSGTFTVPAGVTEVLVTEIGGGAGGGGTNADGNDGGGGGGGGESSRFIHKVTPAAELTVTIGAGGAGGVAAADGVSGGETSFDSIPVSGGVKGLSGANDGTGGAGASANSTDLDGADATDGIGAAGNAMYLSFAGGAGGSSTGLANSGGGGGGSVAIGTGAGGAGGSTSENGNPGVGFGCGGGGAGDTGTDKTGGAGIAGLVIVQW